MATGVNIADYQPLSNFDHWLSSFGLLGLFNKRRKLLVEDRTFKCWFVLKTTRPQYLNIKIASEANDLVREAMSARVRYFNWRGREIDGAHHFTRGRRGSRKRLSFLFADPLEEVQRQRLWLRPPNGARFVLLTFERASYEGWLGLSTKIKLKRLKRVNDRVDREILFEKLIKSRDRMRMTWFLRQLKIDARLYSRDQQKDSKDPVTLARAMLGQMIYLWQGVEEKRLQLIIDDALHLSRFGFDLGRAVMPSPKTGGEVTSPPTNILQNDLDSKRVLNSLEYTAPLNENWRASGILSKQMRLEAMVLIQHIQEINIKSLTIREGHYYLARILIALAVKRLTGITLIIDVRETLSSRVNLGEWLHWRELKGWLGSGDTQICYEADILFLVKDEMQKAALIDCAIEAQSIIEESVFS